MHVGEANVFVTNWERPRVGHSGVCARTVPRAVRQNDSDRNRRTAPRAGGSRKHTNDGYFIIWSKMMSRNSAHKERQHLVLESRISRPAWQSWPFHWF